MHELSLMAEMMDLIRNSAAQNQINRITRIKLVIGKLSMALPHSLRFAFDSMAGEGIFTSAELLIEEREISFKCPHCLEQFIVEQPFLNPCPFCGSLDTEIATGRELFIEYYEGDSVYGHQADSSGD